MQNKFALRRSGGAWFEARGAAPTSHKLKPGVHGLAAQALVEHVSMRAAGACGVDVAHTQYLGFKSEHAVVITRFDRRAGQGIAVQGRTAGDAMVRVHQEDMCQALGVSQKYQEFGGPSAAAIIELLRATARTVADGAMSVSRFVDGLVYNVLIAAPDAHARNYAVLLDGENVRLAPMFDIATSLAYDAPTGGGRALAMSIGGQFDAMRIGREQWIRFAAENRLDPAFLLDRVSSMAQALPGAMRGALDGIDDDWDGAAAALRDRLIPAVDERVRRVQAKLAVAGSGP
jgi:serine/threonine-protein kinase HipA